MTVIANEYALLQFYEPTFLLSHVMKRSWWLANLVFSPIQSPLGFLSLNPSDGNTESLPLYDAGYQMGHKMLTLICPGDKYQTVQLCGICFFEVKYK